MDYKQLLDNALIAMGRGSFDHYLTTLTPNEQQDLWDILCYILGIWREKGE